MPWPFCQESHQWCSAGHDVLWNNDEKTSHLIQLAESSINMCGSSILRPPASVLKIPPKVKEKRRNSEKRKEKSRDAARCRRGKESEIFTEMLSYLPLSTDVANTLDKMSILRLALNALRLEQFVAPLRKPESNLPAEIKALEEEITTGHDTIPDMMDTFVLVLIDDGEQLEPIFVSEGVQRKMGLAVSELLGVSLESFVHPCDYQELRTLFVSLHDEDSDSWERIIPIRMKCTISAKGRVVNIKSASYKVVKFHLKFVLRQQRHYLTALCEPMGPFMTKVRPTITHFFDAALSSNYEFNSQHTPCLLFKSVDGNFNFIGFSQQQLAGMTLYNLVHPADMTVLSGHFKELFVKGYCNTGCYRLLGPRGGFCWVSTKAQLIHDTSSKPTTVNCVHYAISDIQDSETILTDFQHLNRLPQQQHERLDLNGNQFSQLDLNGKICSGIRLEDCLDDLAGCSAVAATAASNQRHVLILVPSGVEKAAIDGGALGGLQLPSCPSGSVLPSSSATSSPSVFHLRRQVGGAPLPVAGEEAPAFSRLHSQFPSAVATYERSADLTASQVSRPVAVVGQSKNNQLDNNNTGEQQQAVCASLALETYHSVQVGSDNNNCAASTQAAAPATTNNAANPSRTADVVECRGGNSKFQSTRQAQPQALHQRPTDTLDTRDCSVSRVFPGRSCDRQKPSSTTLLDRSDLFANEAIALFHPPSEVLKQRETLLCDNSTDLCDSQPSDSSPRDEVPDLLGSDSDCPPLESPEGLDDEVIDVDQPSEPCRVPAARFADYETSQSRHSIGKKDDLYESKSSQLNKVPESCTWTEQGWLPRAATTFVNDPQPGSANNLASNTPAKRPSTLTSTLSVFARRTEEMSPGFLHIKGGQVLTCEEPNLDLTHLAPTAGDSAMPLEVEFEVCDDIPENLFPSLLDSAGSSPLSSPLPYDDALTGYSDLPPALLDGISDNLQLETDSLLLASDWPLASSSLEPKSTTTLRKSLGPARNFIARSAPQTTSTTKTTTFSITTGSSDKPMLAALLQSDLAPPPSSVSQKQRAMVHDWGGTTQPLPDTMQHHLHYHQHHNHHSHQRRSTPVKFVPQKVQQSPSLTINALKRPLTVSQRNSLDGRASSNASPLSTSSSSSRSSSGVPLKRRKTVDSLELQPKPVEKGGSVLMKLLVSGEDIPNGYSCRVLQEHRDRSLDKERDLRSAQEFLCSLASQLDNVPASVGSDSSDFCNLLSADDDFLIALAAATQE